LTRQIQQRPTGYQKAPSAQYKSTSVDYCYFFWKSNRIIRIQDPINLNTGTIVFKYTITYTRIGSTVSKTRVSRESPSFKLSCARSVGFNSVVFTGVRWCWWIKIPTLLGPRIVLKKNCPGGPLSQPTKLPDPNQIVYFGDA
jgi:hypothetical protein